MKRSDPASAPSISSVFSIRAAAPVDLNELLRLTLAGLGLDALLDAVEPEDIHGFHEHALSHGRLLVAADGDRIGGYASAIERDGMQLLCQVFVRDDLQSSGIGRRLISEIDPPGDVERLLVASADKRAIGLYVRRGYIPAWPVYTLEIGPDALERLPTATAAVKTTKIDDSFVELDAAVSGRSRRDDLRYWTDSTGGTPYLVSRDGTSIGFAWIHDPRFGTMSKWHGVDARLHVGPVGAHSPHDARESVLATLDAVRQGFPGRGAAIEIGGPHSALPDLLRAGARIVDAETFMSTTGACFGLPEIYVPSGGVLY